MGEKVEVDREVLATLLATFETQTDSLRRRPGVGKAVAFRDQIIARAQEAIDRK